MYFDHGRNKSLEPESQMTLRFYQKERSYSTGFTGKKRRDKGKLRGIRMEKKLAGKRGQMAGDQTIKH